MTVAHVGSMPSPTPSSVGSDWGWVSGLLYLYLSNWDSCRTVVRASESAVAILGNPLSDRSSFYASNHCREGAVLSLSSLFFCLLLEPCSLLNSLDKRNTFQAQVERPVTEKHRLWNSNLNSLTLAAWPWAMYLISPNPQFLICLSDVYYLAGLIWELKDYGFAWLIMDI